MLMSASSTATKLLQHLLAGVEYICDSSIEDIGITGLCSDSRQVQPGCLFAALKGSAADGHNFLRQAVSSGCSALLVNRDWQDSVRDAQFLSQVPVVAVADTRAALGYIAANFYDHPDRELTMIGITGTNGKTTTSFLVESMLKACGRRPGVIGTVNYRYPDQDNNFIEEAAPFTTPESPTLYALLRKMADEQVTDVVMEVSSHGLAQSRVAGMGFDIAVFTNLSRDHLDFHPDMHRYFSSKRLLFTDYLKPGARIVIMVAPAETGSEKVTSGGGTDRNWGRQMHQELTDLFQSRHDSPPITTCGLEDDCDVYPRNYSMDIRGITADIKCPGGSLSLKTPLAGEFNLRNLLCAIAIGLAHDEKMDCIQRGLEEVKTVPGRLERVDPGETAAPGPAVFVDYAHTPDALENVLTTLLQLQPRRLVCVFGCGGDRDPGKRVLMGEIAGRLCDVVLATSDNPRSENPEMILAEIERGLAQTGLQKGSASKILSSIRGRGYDIISNRHLAISTAIRFADPDDLILISGKGHENYQISSKGKIFFDDRIEAEMQLQAKFGLPLAWKVPWVQQITGGHLLSPVATPVTFRNISTDTRAMHTGDLFVALQGEQFDGRMFCQKAVEKGAAGLLINGLPGGNAPVLDFQPPVPVLLVPDTLAALGQLGATLRRWNSNLQVVAITGSSGKTTVKEMTASILEQNRVVLKTEGNFNNLIGLPLTLLRLQPEHEIAVLEMGMNRPGEIADLTAIGAPDIACIINVQEAHLEGLGDIQGVAQAKNELFAGLTPEARVAVNLDDAIVTSLAAKLQQEKITFGLHPDAFVCATDIKSQGANGMTFTLHVGRESREVTIRALGKHNVTNGLAAAALAHGAGSSIDEIAAGLAAFQPYEKRVRVETLPSGVRILNDCYNANPASMLAALNTLIDLKKNHRAVAVLGDMLELGDKSNEAHATLGRTVQELGFDFLAAYGSQAQNMANSAKDAGMAPAAAKNFSSKKELAAWLQKLLREGLLTSDDWILIKGSRGMRMEEVLELLYDNKLTHQAAGN
jgi:murE/murF fusion protein